MNGQRCGRNGHAEADELQDEREIRDLKIRAAIRRGREEFLVGRTRPIGEFFAERAARAQKRGGRLPGA
jgi:hypothetical protein